MFWEDYSSSMRTHGRGGGKRWRQKLQFRLLQPRRRACVTESDASWELGDLGFTPQLSVKGVAFRQVRRLSPKHGLSSASFQKSPALCGTSSGQVLSGWRWTEKARSRATREAACGQAGLRDRCKGKTGAAELFFSTSFFLTVVEQFHLMGAP